MCSAFDCTLTILRELCISTPNAAQLSTSMLMVACLISGIGKSIAFRLARQGLNVVVVALGDQLLDTTFNEIQEAFPRQQFRKVWPHDAQPYLI
jgi:hypothetical protein